MLIKLGHTLTVTILKLRSLLDCKCRKAILYETLHVSLSFQLLTYVAVMGILSYVFAIEIIRDYNNLR